MKTSPHLNKVSQRFKTLWSLLSKNTVGLFTKRDVLIIVFFTLLGIGGVFAAGLITVTAPEAQGAGYIAATTCDPSMSVNKNVVFDQTTKRYLVTTISLSDVDQRFDENGINGCGNKVLEMALRINGAVTYTSWSIPIDSGNNTFTYGSSTSSTYQSYQAKTMITPFDATSLDGLAIRVLQDNLLSGSLNFADYTYKINYNSDNTFALGSSDFTVDLWAKVKGDITRFGQTFYDAGGNVNAAGGFAFWLEGSKLKLRFNGMGQDLEADFLTGWRNSWHHYAAVRSGTTFTIYVDGNSVATVTYPVYDINRTAPVVGALSNFPLNYSLVGEIRNLRVVKGTALWSSAFTAPAAPLANVSGTVLLLLVQNSSNPTYDSSNYHWVPANTSNLPIYVAP